MTYLKWLNTQSGHNALVDFKEDILNDGDFPESNNPQDMKEYLIEQEAPSQVFKLFYWSYGLYVKERKKEVNTLEADFLREIEEDRKGNL